MEPKRNNLNRSVKYKGLQNKLLNKNVMKELKKLINHAFILTDGNIGHLIQLEK